MVISFLGPDGSGKSTIIDGIMAAKLPFNDTSYFHLKPNYPKNSGENVVVVDPHRDLPYNAWQSYLKLLVFIFQYNFGWIKNILPLKQKGNLIIFDRYYHDMLVDTRRYRYGGKLKMAQFVSNFIPSPDIFFVLTADAHVINARKQEVSFEELERQVFEYRLLGKCKKFHNVDVNRQPEIIIEEVIAIISTY